MSRRTQLWRRMDGWIGIGKSCFSVAAVALLLAHSLIPERVLVDAISVGLLLIVPLPWIAHLIERFEAFGVGITRTPQSPTQIQADAEAETAELRREVTANDQRGNLASDYALAEVRALGALSSELVPGWVLTAKETIQSPRGAIRLDAVIQGPQGSRDTVVEIKAIPRTNWAQSLAKHVAQTQRQAEEYAAITGKAYQPMVLWISVARRDEKLEFVPGPLIEAIANTGIYGATYDLKRGQLSFLLQRPAFVSQDVHIIGSRQI